MSSVSDRSEIRHSSFESYRHTIRVQLVRTEQRRWYEAWIAGVLNLWAKSEDTIAPTKHLAIF